MVVETFHLPLRRPLPRTPCYRSPTRRTGQPPPRLTEADCLAAFSRTRPFTIGVEEELMLLDPESLDLAPAIEEVLPLLDGDPRFTRELRAAQLEIVSPGLRERGGDGPRARPRAGGCC